MKFLIDDNLAKFNHYKMINISEKKSSYRRACVSGSIYVGKKVFYQIKNKKIEKGDPIVLAEVSGINAAKNVSNLILLCHQVNLEHIFFNIIMDEKTFKIDVYCIVMAYAKTGVEMEALCGVSIALLTIYDLTKKINPFILIKEIKLLFKDGGENGLILGSINNLPVHLKKTFIKKYIYLNSISILLITMSDRAFNGYYNDISGQFLLDYFTIKNAKIFKKLIISDNVFLLRKIIENLKKIKNPQLIIITGGTGVNKRDITYNSLSTICSKKIYGLSELLRLSGSSYSIYSWLSSSFFGVYNDSLILSLPGNPSAIMESLEILEPLFPHILNLIKNYD